MSECIEFDTILHNASGRVGSGPYVSAVYEIVICGCFCVCAGQYIWERRFAVI